MSDRKHQRRAREIQRTNPGMKYTQALRIALAETEAKSTDPRLLRERLEEILAASVGRPLVGSVHGGYAPVASDLVHRMYLQANDDRGAIELGVYPGDTLEQAKALYQRPDVLDALRALCVRSGWMVEPNFHFGFMTQGLCWTQGSIQLDAYIALWQQRIADEWSVVEADWDWYWDELVELGVVDPDSREEFDDEFTHTGRSRATPRPGLVAIRSWPLREAEALDRAGRFVDEVRSAGRVALDACQASIVERTDPMAA